MNAISVLFCLFIDLRHGCHISDLPGGMTLLLPARFHRTKPEIGDGEIQRAPSANSVLAIERAIKSRVRDGSSLALLWIAIDGSSRKLVSTAAYTIAETSDCYNPLIKVSGILSPICLSLVILSSAMSAMK